MELELLRVFQRQVQLQCQFMLKAAHEANAGLDQRDTGLIFYALQNLLNAAANVSKALWGQGGKFTAERKDLRDSIGVTDASPLRSVTMRNNFEHFDERLDKWWRDSKAHHNFDLSIGPPSGIAGVDHIDLFRRFDPATTDLWFWNQDFNTQEIINEVQRILPKLTEEASKPHWKT
jgi:hypothetical protein